MIPRKVTSLNTPYIINMYKHADYGNEYNDLRHIYKSQCQQSSGTIPIHEKQWYPHIEQSNMLNNKYGSRPLD